MNKAIFIVLCLALSVHGYRGGSTRSGRCSDEVSLGEVLEVSSTPANVKSGQPLEVILRLRTQFKPEGTWSLQERINANGVSNNYPVPERDKGSIRSSFRKESQVFKKTDTYTFTLNLDAHNPKVTIHFYLVLAHQCNSVYLNAVLEVWRNLTGMALPIALHVPESIVDLRSKNQASMPVGLKVDHSSAMIISQGSWVFDKEIRNGQIVFKRFHEESDYVSLDWRPASDRSVAPQYVSRLEGEIVFNKEPTEVKDTEAYLMFATCTIYLNKTSVDHRHHLTSLRIRTPFLILFSDIRKPAIGLINYQFNENVLDYNDNFYDTNGMRVLPMSQERSLTLPTVFECFAIAGGNRPFIASARVRLFDDGLEVDEILHGLYSPMTQGNIAYQAYVASLNTEITNYICSAGSAGEVSNMYFKVMRCENVRITSTNPNVVTLDGDTFREGYRFTCRAEGSPKPTIRFFKQTSYEMDYEPYAKGLANPENNEELQVTDRITLESDKEGERTLVISPGNNPFDSYKDDVKFRLTCIGVNQFTADATFVDFIAPVTTTSP